MARMTVELVAVERRLWSGEASFVFARTTEGEIGVLPGHEPTLAELDQAGGVRSDTTDVTSVSAAGHGGFLSVTPESVTVRADLAELAPEIDVQRARAAASRADEGTDEGAAARARAEARLKAAESV
jgi:F-type H+-transporting ATPase subunit epsilon